MPEQSAKSHAAIDPVIMAVLLTGLLNIILAIYRTIKIWPMHSRLDLWWIVMSIAFFVLAFRVRGYGTKNQDRIIRLEERLRLATLLPAAHHSSIHSLTTPQLVALRFAHDSELPALSQRTLAENLGPKQIKAAIITWRPDHHRI